MYNQSMPYVTDAQFLVHNAARAIRGEGFHNPALSIVSHVAHVIALNGVYVITAQHNLKLRTDIRRLASLGFNINLGYNDAWHDRIFNFIFRAKPTLTIVVTL